MDKEPTQITDHEAILLLRQDVRGLKESQDMFHKEMKDSFKDLKDNYATRLDLVEKGLNDADRVFIAKDVQDKKNEIYETDIESLKSSKAWLWGFSIGLTCLIGIAGSLVSYIFLNNSNAIQAQQELQNQQINTIMNKLNI
jgi:hypothetical protein